MALPEAGKKYLVVFCKRCDKGFRVYDQAFGEGIAISMPATPLSLTCRGCAHTATYEPGEMRVASIGRNPEKNRQ